MINQRNLDNAYLDGSAWARRVLTRFEAGWNRPTAETIEGMLWATLPQPLKERLLLEHPETFREIERRYGGK
ncbi:MAG TPA: hypothetical protein GYA06_12805 [Chloroflexi bacterium]|nr:hypothetical protein [Chloroflexota bacterium]HOJ56611.1 hypothetical protein [Phycisphaerae bacterium]